MLLFIYHSHLLHFGSDPLCTHAIRAVQRNLDVLALLTKRSHILILILNLVLKVTAPIIATLPLLWVINHHPFYLFFIQIISGFAWAGFNLCATNFIYDAVSPQKRTRCIAYFNVFNGIALCLGALIGGFLIEKLPPFLGYKIFTLFLISSFLRMTVAIFMPTKLKEVRSVEKISSYQLFFSLIGVKSFLDADRKTI